jgi:chromosome partitioning protein
MRTIAVICQKGGAGKTTLSLNLAIAAVQARKRVALLDADPQRSAVKWSKLRTNKDPAIFFAQEPELPGALAAAQKAGADWLIIDTAPHSEKTALTAAQLSDFVLIPVKPSNLDLDAIADTVNIARLTKKPAAFVLNDCKTASTLTREALEALATFNLPTASVQLGSRVAFIKALKYGQGVLEHEPSSPAAKEVRALYRFVAKKMEDPNG